MHNDLHTDNEGIDRHAKIFGYTANLESKEYLSERLKKIKKRLKHGFCTNVDLIRLEIDEINKKLHKIRHHKR